MINPKHESYSCTDFLDDVSFINAIKYNREADVAYWERWKDSSPRNLSAYLEAEIQLRVILSASPIVPTKEFLDTLWNDINQSLEDGRRLKIKRKQRMLWYAAASISVIVSFSVWFFNSTISIVTPYGTTKEVILPDGSKVLLNANTELKYPRAYNWKDNREVLLKGEAYFAVEHGRPFFARTKNLSVAVLGTEFNIKERRGVTSVALVKGKIEVRGTSFTTVPPTLMKPKEIFRYEESSGKVLKSHTVPEVHTAWIEKKVLANNTTIGSILKDFEDTYGQRVVLEDTTLMERVIDGVVPMGDKDNTMFVIANILNAEVYKKGDTIILKTHRANK
ncbi:FecR family protein [Sphingobacterium faecale]|uniref:FecR domain-containing protein n=1 Tax=Sphingobacterium faecale TaxID=2803775 RepID=A0ABS1R208_9SPHI|nr:FecR domain-containing protein [Sphingobacterium faecale]MBL1408736.1 FecR domain-containing protein [Sphingobacterium faecale]